MLAVPAPSAQRCPHQVPSALPLAWECPTTVLLPQPADATPRGHWQGQLLPLFQPFMPGKHGNTWPCPWDSPAPADGCHDQRRDPGHCAHHDQPCRGGGDTKGQRVSWQHGDTGPCCPGEGVKPLPLSRRVSPSTMLSFAGMGDASTGYFCTVAVVGRLVAATVPAGPHCRRPSLSPLAMRCLLPSGTRVPVGEDRAVSSAGQLQRANLPGVQGLAVMGPLAPLGAGSEHLLLDLPSCSGWWRGASCLASTSARKSISASKLGTEVRPMGEGV